LKWIKSQRIGMAGDWHTWLAGWAIGELAELTVQAHCQFIRWESLSAIPACTDILFDPSSTSLFTKRPLRYYHPVKQPSIRDKNACILSIHLQELDIQSSHDMSISSPAIDETCSSMINFRISSFFHAVVPRLNL
jgi:hypothetical protein